MQVLGPHPRFRIYTSPQSYNTVLQDIFRGPVAKRADCRNFEREIQQRVGMPFAVCTPQARVGIYLAVKATTKPGQKVILSPYTIADVVNMVICAGGVPVFADVERDTCNIDPREIENLIDDNTGAVLVTHLHGLACSLDQILNICNSKQIPLIEDAAQAFGALFNGKAVGTFGDAGIYSFGMYKNCTAFYGGMVTTPHADMHAKIRAQLGGFPYMDRGRFIKKVLNGLAADIATFPPLFRALVFWIFRFGHLHDIKFINKYVETELDLSRKEELPEHYLRRMTPLQARLAMRMLKRLQDDTAQRIRHARLYHEGLSDLPEVRLPPCRVDGSHIYTHYPIQYHDRQALIRWMISNRRDVGVQHLKNCADLKAFERFYRDCPKARATAQDVILLPTYPRYTEKEVKRNIKVMRAFFGK